MSTCAVAVAAPDSTVRLMASGKEPANDPIVRTRMSSITPTLGTAVQVTATPSAYVPAGVVAVKPPT